MIRAALAILASLLLAGPLHAQGTRPGPASPAAPSAPAGNQAMLVCRMGGNMVWSVISQLDTVPTTIEGRAVRVPVVSALFAQLVFAKASLPVSPVGAGLGAGVCGWTDRGMTQGEPNRVVESLSSFMFQETVLWGNGSTLRGETTMSGGHLNFQNNAVFSMLVTRDASADVQFQVVAGTTPKLVSPK